MGAIANWLKNNFKAGDSPIAFCSARQHNRVANILQDLQGIGCRIDKPLDAEGRGWRIVIDGSSDIPPPAALPGSTPATLIHFGVYQVSSTSVAVRGGTVESLSHGARYAVNLLCDGGASGDLTNVKTLTTPGLSNATVYVLTTKDYPLEPTSLTVTLSNTQPNANDKKTRQIAHFTLSAGTIAAGSLVQDWSGGNWREVWNAPDGDSLAYNATDLDLEIKGWRDDVASVPMSPAVWEIHCRTAAAGLSKFVTLVSLASAVSDWTGVAFTGATGPWAPTSHNHPHTWFQSASWHTDGPADPAEANRILISVASGAPTWIAAPSGSANFLKWTGAAFSWATIAELPAGYTARRLGDLSEDTTVLASTP
jgi:hypothetical protein